MRKRIKRKALERRNDSAGHIVWEEAVHNGELPYKDVKDLKESAYRALLQHRPSLPKSRTEVFEALENVALELFAGFDVFLQDREMEVIMLRTEIGINHLSTAHRVPGYGASKYCAKFFT